MNIHGCQRYILFFHLKALKELAAVKGAVTVGIEEAKAVRNHVFTQIEQLVTQVL